MLSRVDPTTLAEAGEGETFGEELDGRGGGTEVGGVDVGGLVGVEEVDCLATTSDHPQDGAMAPAKWLEC